MLSFFGIPTINYVIVLCVFSKIMQTHCQNAKRLRRRFLKKVSFTVTHSYHSAYPTLSICSDWTTIGGERPVQAHLTVYEIDRIESKRSR